MQMTVQALHDELRIQRDLNQLFEQDSNSRTGEPCVAELTEENFQRLHTEHERQAKELFLLRKTLEEMELRIETQKQTLNARDESTRSFWRCCRARGFLLRLLRRTMREQGDWQRQRCMSTTSKALWSRRKKRTLC